MMKYYTYVCTSCGGDQMQLTEYVPIGTYILSCICDYCFQPRMQRIASFYYRRDMPDHFNHSLGHHVSNRRAFSDGLKRKSDEASARTGMDHNYVEVDPTERTKLGVTEEGLHESNVRRRALNWRELPT